MEINCYSGATQHIKCVLQLYVTNRLFVFVKITSLTARVMCHLWEPVKPALQVMIVMFQISGREMFEFNPELMTGDDDDAAGDIEYERDEDGTAEVGVASKLLSLSGLKHAIMYILHLL